jgi:hypothetical protein
VQLGLLFTLTQSQVEEREGVLCQDRFDPRVYIDIMGVPRRLPDGFWIGIKHLLVITAATRLMGCQNRKALDMLMVEKAGGV